MSEELLMTFSHTGIHTEFFSRGGGGGQMGSLCAENVN